MPSMRPIAFRIALVCALWLAAACQTAVQDRAPRLDPRWSGPAPAAAQQPARVTTQDLKLPLAEGSVRFAVIGDSGTGGGDQRDIARWMNDFQQVFPYTFVLMLGDNLYGSEDPDDYYDKFEEPYAALLEDGVRFYASLGNHDERTQRFYKNFNMDGRTYYTFKVDGDASLRFFALESDYMDRRQLDWIEQELRNSNSDWKIVFFHHPIYSSGERHGSDIELREVLEPLFVRYGVDVVFSGHEHFYERLEPQKGIYYFVSGAAGKLRRGNIGRSNLTAKGFDQDNSFMLVEIAQDELYFQTISRTGKTVDSGSIRLPSKSGPAVSVTEGH